MNVTHLQEMYNTWNPNKSNEMASVQQKYYDTVQKVDKSISFKIVYSLPMQIKYEE